MRKEEFARGALYSGNRGEYQWLTSREHYMGDFVRLCSDVLLGRYLTVTCIDGGSPWLTEAQQLTGWQLRSGMAYSQRLSTVQELFYQRDGDDCPGYDEWYAFDTAPEHLGEILSGNPFVEGNKPEPGRLEVMVSWAGFVLHDTDQATNVFREMFWHQLDWIRPEIYVSDGRDNLTFVCRDMAIFEAVRTRLADALKA